MRAIIIAGGEATRWGGYLGKPKHLAEVDGEPILARTVRLLRENGVATPYIVAKDHNYRGIASGATVYIANLNPKNGDADKFLSSRELWSPFERTVIFYGDVFFTEDAIKRIVEFNSNDWTLFCRKDGSSITGGRFGECFAISFYPKDRRRNIKALEKIANDWSTGRLKRCGGWEFYREIVGLTINDSHQLTTNYVEINDFTEDFDYPEDYDEFIKRYNYYKEIRK